MKAVIIIGIILLILAVAGLMWALCAASGKAEREWEEENGK